MQLQPILSAKPKKINKPSEPIHKEERWSFVQEQLKNSVVQVFAYCLEFNWLEPYKTPLQGLGAGSGFFIDQDGRFITNAHVINQAETVFIQIPAFGKRRFGAIIEGVCPERDLALLRVVPEDAAIIKTGLRGSFTTAPLGDSDNVKRASEILTLGFPLGQESLKSTLGVVSGRHNLDGSSMIQIDAPLNPGNSGGPAINVKGEVIGVNTAGFMHAQNVGYIIPSNEVKLFLHQLPLAPLGTTRPIRFLRKPFLGIIYNESNEHVAAYLQNPVPGGLYVANVYPDSILAKAGIQKGDMIYTINEEPIDSYGEMYAAWSEDKISLIDYISRLLINDTIKLTFYRNGEKKSCSLDFKFSEFPAVRVRYPEYEIIDYEIFGGCVFMELALNHIPPLLKQNPLLGRFTELENQDKGQIIISHILPDSEATRARILSSGTLIKEINHKPVHNLSELRNAIAECTTTGFIPLEVNDGAFVVLSLKKALQDEPYLARRYRYQPTPFVKTLLTNK